DPANGTVSIGKTGRGEEYTWRWADGRQLNFDSKGKLVQILAPNGQFVSLRYDPAGLLTRVTDPQGRRLDLSYPSREQARAGDAFRGVQSIASPVGRFTYHYGSAMAAGADIDKRLLLANLVKVSMPVGARTYHYEQADRPTLLTGISELVNGKAGKAAWQRIATYGYD
ncbi:RHS repeat protein, partial [Xanthomonas campestris pv. campestris]|uniref:RHS repeat domain-containing protein n=1 Tax=Xanthomonas campestris TaxID=339 RepID=UPI002AD271DF